MGIAEQDAVATAAGLALSGKIPVFSTYGVFAAHRANDQIRISVCYNNVHVTEHSIVDHIAIFSLDSVVDHPQPTNQPRCYNIEGGILLTQLNAQTTISVADISGKNLFHQKGFEQEETIIQLPKGCYLLNDGVSWKKIIVTK